MASVADMEIEHSRDNVESTALITAAATVEVALATAQAAIATTVPAESPTAVAAATATTPPFADTNDMPQWRKDLIQRKKKLASETATAATATLTSKIDGTAGQPHSNQSLSVNGQTMSFNNGESNNQSKSNL